MKLLRIGLVALVCAMVVRFSMFTISAGEAAIVTQFGKPVATITEPGLRWKLPGFLQRVNRMDARIEVFNGQPIQLLLGDKNPVIVTTFIAWRVDDPLLFFRSLARAEVARQKLGDMVVSALGSSLADYTLDDIINADPDSVKLEELERRVLNITAPQARDKYGIETIRVGLRRLSYPSIVADAVYNRMRAEREKEARKYRAEGTEAAARIEAATDKDVSQILAEAYKQAEILKGHGDQEATRIYAQAYGRDAEFFDFLKSLDLYRAALKEKSTLILSTDSELFRYLGTSSPRSGQNSQ
ncbi:MAG: protease modulator HflC [Candidatus Eisenbacteria bacterium]|jgi:membrane protease subunit HflC|nr:protease modulator HflC [Candidatus Eisenbacteria bacterium]